jgi:predicted nucleotidyltransferase
MLIFLISWFSYIKSIDITGANMDVLKPSPIPIASLIQSSAQLPEIIPTLKMLILFGSRARGNSHSNSDWDFAFLCDSDPENVLFHAEIYGILADLFRINDDKIDAINLAKCPPLIAHAIAQDGKVLYERDLGLFSAFQQRALMTEEQLKEINKSLSAKLERFLAERET